MRNIDWESYCGPNGGFDLMAILKDRFEYDPEDIPFVRQFFLRIEETRPIHSRQAAAIAIETALALSMLYRKVNHAS